MTTEALAHNYTKLQGKQTWEKQATPKNKWKKQAKWKEDART